MKLFSWGANSYGQLGHGVTSEQCVVPLEIQYETSEPSCILSVTGGGGHTMVLCKDGQVFGCGWNKKGQLGPPVNSDILTFKQLGFLSDYKVHQVFCGWECSLAITHSRELLTWGSNSYYELGLNKNKVKLLTEPVSIPVPCVENISCGLRHTAIVTGNGQVLMCGTGRKGQLGLVTPDGYPQSEAVQPVIVPGVDRVKSVACGQYHSVAVTDTGHLLVWGDNRHGQLGLDPVSHPVVHQPFEIQPFQKETLPGGCTVYCGWTHTVLLTDEGEVFNWGRNSYGQLGCYEHERPDPWKPAKLESVNGVKQIVVGSEHNLALLDSGEAVSWGWNEHGNCGTGTEENVYHPTPVGIGKKHKAVLIGTGAGHSFAVVED